MRGRLLLDTTLAVDILRGRQDLRDELDEAENFYLPTIAIGELYYGAYRSNTVADNLSEVRSLVASSAILQCDAGTAFEYGQLRYELAKRGRPLPQNDVWIAALARQHGLAVATRDAHYRMVPGLETVSW